MNDEVLNEEFLLKPIGAELTVNPNNLKWIFPDINTEIKVELYCPICKEKRIFTCNDFISTGKLNCGKYNCIRVINNVDKELLIYDFFCEFYHSFKIALESLGKGKFVKFGQYPSPIKYNKIVNNQIFKILDNREKEYYLLAVKARENNLNIASFLYLRRVFESLVKKAEEKSQRNLSGVKMKEKIQLLVKENLLNEMLNDNGYNVLYSLLSDGIHNLEEEECQSQFELLKSAIEIILEDEIYKTKLKKNKKIIGNLLNKKNSETK